MSDEQDIADTESFKLHGKRWLYAERDAAETAALRAENARLLTVIRHLQCDKHNVLEALGIAATFTQTARNYFPKSIRNADKFQLEQTCAAIGNARAALGVTK